MGTGVEKLSIEAPNTPSPLSGMYMGLVTDRDDPLELNRIRFYLAGLFEGDSPWARPLGTFGSSPQQGIAWQPELKSFVALWFIQGDPLHPVYLPGPWAIPDNINEMPTETQESPDVKAIKTKKFRIIFDDREGQEKLLIESLDGKTKINLDPVTSEIKIESIGEILVKGTNDVTIESTSKTLVKGTVEIGAGPIQKVCLATLISQINLLTFGGFGIDAVLVATDGINQSTNVQVN